MTAVPVTRTFVAGEVVLDTHFNTNIRDVLNFLLAPPIFKGRQTVAQTLTTAVDGPITLDAEDVDSAGGHSTVTNTSRYTAVYAGWYFLGGGVGFATSATGLRLCRWRVNGTLINDSDTMWPGIGTASARYPARGTMVFLNVGDYVEIVGQQTSGGNLLTVVTANEQSSVSLKWISN